MLVRWFDARDEAARWARAFSFARHRSRWPLLRVVPTRGWWGVDNPTFTPTAMVPAPTPPPRRRSAGLWIKRVSSSSRDGVFHRLAMRGAVAIRCSCEGFTYRNTCVHMNTWE